MIAVFDTITVSNMTLYCMPKDTFNPISQLKEVTMTHTPIYTQKYSSVGQSHHNTARYWKTFVNICQSWADKHPCMSL